MAKIFELDFRKGSIVDKVTGVVPTIAGTGKLYWDNSGYMFGDKTIATLGSSIAIPSTTTFTNSGDWSVVLSYNFNRINNSGELYPLVSKSSATVGWNLYMYTNGVMSFEYNNGTYLSSFATPTISKNNLVVLNYTSGVLKIYVNNILVSSTSITITAQTSDNFRLGMFKGSGGFRQCVVGICKGFSNALTTQEIDKEYTDFVSTQPISKPKRGFLVNKPNDLSSEVNDTLGADIGIPRTWEVTSGSPTINGDVITLPNDGAVDSVRISNFWSIGKRYKVSATISNYTGTSTVILPYDGSISTGTAFSANGTYVYEYVPSTVHCSVYGRATNGATVTVHSIQEMTGLVAAYNMKPNGLTLTDISGNGNTITLTQNQGSISRTVNGLRVNNGVNGSMATALTLNNFSFCARCINDGTSSNFIIGDGGSSNYISTQTTGGIVVRLGGGTALTFNSASPVGREFDLVFVKNGTSAKLYIDGVLFQEQTFASDYTASFNKLPSYNSTITAYFFNGELIDSRVYNRILSLQEAKDYHNSFAKQPYLVEDFSDLPADGNAVVPRDWTKVSGSFKGGEISISNTSAITGTWANNGTYPFEAVTFSGFDVLNASETTSRGIIAINITPAVGKRYRISFRITNLSMVGTSTKLVYAASTGLTTFATAGYFQAIQEGMNTFDITGETGFGYIGLRCENGSTVSFDSLTELSVVEIPPLPTLTKGSKYLENLAAESLIVTPSNQAFGTWEFDFFKGNDSNTTYINFISSGSNAGNANTGYQLLFNNDESLAIRRTNGSASDSTKLATAANYIKNNTWYRFKITRTTSGVFTLFIKGGDLTPTAGYDGWRLVSVTGGSGANPSTADITYTTSNYFVVNNKIADRFANLKLTNGVII